LLGAVAEKNGLSRDEAGKRLDGLLAGLQFLDRVEVRQRTSQGQVVLTFVVQTAQPLKK
jgi:hypothetical protein